MKTCRECFFYKEDSRYGYVTHTCYLEPRPIRIEDPSTRPICFRFLSKEEERLK